MHAWDLDTEGYGNPRVIERSGFSVGQGLLGNTAIDLGADECDELIMGGFIDGTRIFSMTPPGAPLVLDHRRVFFFDAANATGKLRPHHNAIEGKTWEWWPHVQGAPDAVPGKNYTAGVPGSFRASLIMSAGRTLFMRNLECDFGPLLLSDPHSKWPNVSPFNGPDVDIYGSHPWWWYPPSVPPQRFDNAAAYDNVNAAGMVAHGPMNVTAEAFGLKFTPIISGTLNPPGALKLASRYLDGAYPGQVFVYAPCTSTLSYGTDAWGIGDTGVGCPDWIPMTAVPARGVRFNCQVRDYTDTFPFVDNLQTFLGINNTAPVIDEALLEEPSPEASRRHGDDVIRNMRGRGR